MSLTRLQMRTLIQGNTSRTDKDTLINSHMTLAVDEIGRRHSFQEQESEITLTLNDGDLSIALPAGTQVIKELRYVDGTNSVPVSIRPKTVIVKLFPTISTLSFGRTAYAYVENDVLYVIPGMSGTHTLKATVVSQLNVLDDDNDTLQVSGLENTVISYATWKLFASLQQYADASYWEQQFEKDFAKAIANDMDKPGVEYDLQEYPEMAVQLIPPYLDPFYGFGKKGW
jgi:hypothetical protein